MVYVCISMIEDPPTQQSSEKRVIWTKRKVVAEKFDTDKSVLAEIGHLSTARGQWMRGSERALFNR